MAKWTFTPVAAHDWEAVANDQFWKRFARQHPSRKSQMLKAQLPVLPEEAANELAGTFTDDGQADTVVRDAAFEFLIERALSNGRGPDAANHAVLNCRATGGNRTLVSTTILDHGSAQNAADAAVDLRNWVEQEKWTPGEALVALLLEHAGDPNARSAADDALDTMARDNPHWRYAGVVHSLGSRQLDRALFRLARRGGQVRMAGLLDNTSSLTPSTLAARLATHVYFDEAAIESTDNRVIVDLDEFSLDFRFTDDSELLRHTQRTYDGFSHDDRRFIPPAPLEVTHALLVVAIGDDLSLPDVVNPMIELSVLLEDFGECVFLQRVGPLSRNTEYATSIEAIDTKAFDKLVRASITPLMKDAGFGRRTARRFDLSGGPRGFHATVAISFFPDQRHRVVAYLAMYYTDELDPAWLDRYRNKKGEFTPKAQLVTPNLHDSAMFDMVPSDPGAETVTAVVDDLAELIKNDWLDRIREAERPAPDQ